MYQAGAEPPPGPDCGYNVNDPELLSARGRQGGRRQGRDRDARAGLRAAQRLILGKVPAGPAPL